MTDKDYLNLNKHAVSRTKYNIMHKLVWQLDPNTPKQDCLCD